MAGSGKTVTVPNCSSSAHFITYTETALVSSSCVSATSGYTYCNCCSSSYTCCDCTWILFTCISYSFSGYTYCNCCSSSYTCLGCPWILFFCFSYSSSGHFVMYVQFFPAQGYIILDISVNGRASTLQNIAVF